MRWILLSAISTFTFVSEASAGDCTTGDAPSPYDGYTCDAGGTDICSLQAADTRINCGLGLNGSNFNATATAVTGYASSTYTVWGTDASNVAFCCAFPAGSVTDIEVHGGTRNDNLSFTYTEMSTRYDLGPATSWSVAGLLVGEDGNDIMHGSYETVDYSETLMGQNGNDTIYGHDGEDTCNGGEGEDRIDGGAGDNDTLLGGPGPDIICDHDDDVIYGGTEEDDMWLPITSSGLIDGQGSPNSCGHNLSSVTFTDCLYRTTTPPACP